MANSNQNESKEQKMQKQQNQQNQQNQKSDTEFSKEMNAQKGNQQQK
ncbi:hypothetical protein J9317_07575 [Metabacillus sp. KIGAM252]|uniref:Small, acid-soluble spore protein gamma-type n=1 Tax=Metabacillus flavus TaxID=2823519 RepID=A0ABS5LDX6_9BACI|nr:hypothetical protein [Metabacillus flavus]MBS2968614.1 hypothetical protein [Metabacillus flavus]